MWFIVASYILPLIRTSRERWAMMTARSRSTSPGSQTFEQPRPNLLKIGLFFSWSEHSNLFVKNKAFLESSETLYPSTWIILLSCSSPTSKPSQDFSCFFSLKNSTPHTTRPSFKDNLGYFLQFPGLPCFMKLPKWAAGSSLYQQKNNDNHKDSQIISHREVGKEGYFLFQLF